MIWRKKPRSCGNMCGGWPIGEPASDELYAMLVNATNDRYATGPEPGQYIPDFVLPDQYGHLRSLSNLSGPNGLLLVFHRSADW